VTDCCTAGKFLPGSTIPGFEDKAIDSLADFYVFCQFGNIEGRGFAEVEFVLQR
jgi:hypothetical protein